MSLTRMKLLSVCTLVGLMTLSTIHQACAADVSMSDKNFFENAAQANKAEIAASEMAKSKSKNPQVLKFADQMIKDHTEAYAALSALAKTKGVEIPTEPSLMQKAKAKLLSTKDGKDFDEEYAESIGVAAHKDTVELFEKTAKNADDADVKQFANKMLPGLKHHLAEAKKLKASTDD
ncbi:MULTISPECIES: DUF4142 domain-containing protein [Methylovorus]|uniref:Putative secreted protein n=1 Tax=Methylovorus glucosotrophus (strain SIP3-4) TaxID=582744 RepID=C6XDF2_METGS|nr:MULTISPECIES: DUF4142 domain-containing protein [Methylovorus]ACT50577.1 putative secreted protein [Methylovorus glucosotrophus SIP3-4]ADQ84571.1 putative secreted protein [Methylovorus sp. MP688]KAF0844017.1 putative membrane protein [Methylovorus glucosotrophus]